MQVKNNKSNATVGEDVRGGRFGRVSLPGMEELNVFSIWVLGTRHRAKDSFVPSLSPHFCGERGQPVDLSAVGCDAINFRRGPTSLRLLPAARGQALAGNGAVSLTNLLAAGFRRMALWRKAE